MAVFLNLNTNNFNQVTSYILDSVEYKLHVYWNQRIEGWYFSMYDPELYQQTVADSDSALIYGGRKILPNQNLLERATDDRLPKGLFVCVDTFPEETTEELFLTKDNFGKDKRFQMVYFSEEEIANL